MKITRLIISLLLATLATSVQAETINCTPITSLPATIDAQGLYCLTGNLATGQTSGNAIIINANNVTLDLNGWKVGGQAAGSGTNAAGIYSAAVYRYAVGGEPPDGFDRRLIEGAFRRKG